MSKKLSEYSIADVLRLQPEWFYKKQTDQDKARAHLRQLHHMLDFGFNYLSSHHFYSVFETWDISSLDKSEFNKRLATFDPSAKMRASDTAVRSTLGTLDLIPRPSLLKHLETDAGNVEAECRRLNSKIESLLRDIRSHESNLEDTYRYIHDLSGDVQRRRTTLEALSQQMDKKGKISPERLKLIKAIPKQWVVVDMTNAGFTLVRREPVIVNHTNATSGVARTLYLGFMGFQFTYSLGMVRSFRCADRPDLENYAIHPHVSGPNICWGNVGRRAQDAANKKDYAAWFKLFESILTTYCEDSPYTTMETYQRAPWRDICGDITHMDFWSKHEQALRREWAITGSDKYREAHTHYLAEIAASRTKGPSTLDPSQYLMRIVHQLSNMDHAKGEQYCEPYGGVRGKAYIEMLAQQKIKLPPSNIFAANKLDPDDFNQYLLRAMYLAYGCFQGIRGDQVEWWGQSNENIYFFYTGRDSGKEWAYRHGNNRHNGSNISHQTINRRGTNNAAALDPDYIHLNDPEKSRSAPAESGSTGSNGYEPSGPPASGARYSGEAHEVYAPTYTFTDGTAISGNINW